jgi:hypothetical protein
LAGALAVALPWSWREALPADFGALFRHRASAKRIGQRYLATLSDNVERAGLLARSPVLGQALRTVRRDPAAAARELRQAIADDFRRADTVLVDGWVLATTEARLYAVIALS